MNESVKRGGEPLLSKLYNAEDNSVRFLSLCAETFALEVRNRRPDFLEAGGFCAYIDELFPFDTLQSMMDRSFLHKNVSNDISCSLKNMRQTLGTLVAKTEDGFPCFSFTEDAISDYLDTYYIVLYNLLRYYDSLRQWDKGSDFLKIVLCFGCDFLYNFKNTSEDEIVGVMTPLSPCYISALLEVSKQKRDSQTWRDEQPSKLVEIYKEILRAYTRRYMNWCIVPPLEYAGQICRARLRMYTENEQEKTLLSLPIMPLEKSSSYDGVSEMRLFEKIKYELEREPEPGIDNDQPFQVVLLGEIDYEMFLNFCQLLSYWIDWIDCSTGDIKWATKEHLKIHFRIVTKVRFPEDRTFPPEIKNIEYELVDHYADIFSNSEKFQQLVKESNLLLFLDCCELYEPVRLEPYKELKSFLQQAVVDSCQVPARCADPSDTALESRNTLMRMYSLLTGAAYGDGTPAFLKKAIRRDIVDRLEDIVKTSLQRETAYVYFSDLDAAGEMYWKEDHFLRVEQYACKQIAIMRFGEKNDEQLDNAKGKDERILVFNLWQFIKHTALHRVPSLMEYFGFQGDWYKNVFWMSEVHIGVDYANWSDSLQFYYWAKDIDKIPCLGFEKRLVEYLSEIIIPCFVEQTDNLYTRYLRKCCTAFLYSDAKNVDDMLFLHLFDRCHRQIKKSEIPPKKRDLQDLICRGRKYSGKRFYQEVIEDYDGPSQFFANQYRKLGIMEENGNLTIHTVFDKVKIACESNNYSNSYLYQKCVEKTKIKP